MYICMYMYIHVSNLVYMYIHVSNFVYMYIHVIIHLPVDGVAKHQSGEYFDTTSETPGI